MYGMYVHIKAVTYKLTRFLTKVDQTEVQELLSNTYMFLLYVPIMFVMYNIANWIWLWTMLVENVTMWKTVTKTQELWTNKWCYNALCIDNLVIYGIMNLHSHMYFVRYLDVFTIHSGVSFPLIVLIHVTWLVYKNPFSDQWLYFFVTLYRIC